MAEKEIKEALRSTYKQYYEIKGMAKEVRQTALVNLAEAMANQGNVMKEKVLQALREREKQRNSARKIRHLRGKICTGSTTMVSTIDSEGNKIEITNQQEIEQAILDNNRKKFLQSTNIPFYLSPLKEDFGFIGLTLSAQAALAGLYESNHNLDERVLEVIAQWKMPQKVRDLGPLKMKLTNESYTSFWKKAREETSCYPCELSFFNHESWCL